MKRLVLLMVAMGLLVWVGCSSDSGEETSDAQVAEQPAERQLDYDAPILLKPSGVRYQDLLVGDGEEIVDSMYVTFEVNTYFADDDGVTRESLFHSTKASQQPYFGQVGVTPLEGLSDGLRGMRLGGSRRIFVPKEMGYSTKSPFGGRNLIFEVENPQRATEADVNWYQEEYNNAEKIEEYRRHQQMHDSGGGTY